MLFVFFPLTKKRGPQLGIHGKKHEETIFNIIKKTHIWPWVNTDFRGLGDEKANVTAVYVESPELLGVHLPGARYRVWRFLPMGWGSNLGDHRWLDLFFL